MPLPKLILVAACDRAIFDNGDNRLTIVDLIEGLSATPPPGVEVDHDEATLMPRPWNCVNVWHRTDGNDVAFTQRTEWISPSGEVLTTSEIAVQMTTDRHRQRTLYNGFVLKGSGDYKVRISATEGNEWVTCGEFPVTIRIVDTPPPVDAESATE